MVSALCAVFLAQSVLGQSNVPGGAYYPDVTLLDPNGLGQLLFGAFAVGFEADTVWEENVAEQIVTVTYPGHISIESLDDLDLWVVSRDGYNASARFIAVDEQKPDPEIDENGSIDLGEWLDPATGDLLPSAVRAVTAMYGVKPSSGDTWTEADNGRYVVLLEPDEVGGDDGWALAPRYLGDFRVAVGEPMSLN